MVECGHYLFRFAFITWDGTRYSSVAKKKGLEYLYWLTNETTEERKQ